MDTAMAIDLHLPYFSKIGAMTTSFKHPPPNYGAFQLQYSHHKTQRKSATIVKASQGPISKQQYN